MQLAIVVSIRGCGGDTQEFHLGIASPYSRCLGPKARGCTHGGQNQGVCRVLFCPLVMLVSFFYFSRLLHFLGMMVSGILAAIVVLSLSHICRKDGEAWIGLAI